MSSRIQLRRGTAAQWTSEVLTSGEIGYETDTGNLKIGDGATAWGSLSYYMSPLLTSAIVDLNNADYLRMGRFDLAAPATTYTNGPSLLDAAEGASKLIVTKTGTGYIHQIVSQNYFFTRAYIGGSWQAWKQLPTSDTANTVNTLVRRDASGNFAAGTITATLTGNVTGNVTGSSGSSTGNAATATALATARTIAITGDLAYTPSAFDGTANITAAGTLATVNSNVGSFGSASVIPAVTVNAKGLVTAVSTAAVVAPAGTLSGATLNSGVTASSLTSFGTMVLGTPASGTLTNCVSSSSPSGSTNLATKGYVDNPAYSPVTLFDVGVQGNTAGSVSSTFRVFPSGQLITLTITSSNININGNGSYAQSAYISSGKLYIYYETETGPFYSYTAANSNTISKTYIGTNDGANFIWTSGNQNSPTVYGNASRWGMSYLVLPRLGHYQSGYWTP